ncbi:PBECR2 nuclease fold domain-containing protein [Rhodobacter capsulatus]|uniref:PBECR2 nuclease fold domain-containing protein n=1 Tax=Rhodobacter capsulatus TaxID=1061 RepID=UPI001144A06E|nr:head morphogenesis protein [Rhodobacter capsulatus]
MATVRKAIETAEDFDAAARAVLEIGATWTPDALAALFSQAMQLAALEGREAVFADWEDVSFAETLTRQEFREQIDFLTQKRGKPTAAWTDAMHGDHDRAFVVAGVTDMAMLEEFQQAIIEGARTYDIKAFAAEFDRLVEKYGWSYNGGREWRIRTIFETNIRTSYMAGRLRQMRDPDVVKVRPYWQYRHGETRVPLNPRPEHTSWHNLVLFWNDPWWDTHFPPNDWVCSCGVRTLSRGDLRRMGKDGPDKAPTTTMVKHIDKATGTVVDLPEGIGYGWDYMPGDLWERGLVPSRLLEEAVGPRVAGRQLVDVDIAEPIDDLLAKAVPFSKAAHDASEALQAKEAPEPEDFLRPFLSPFGATMDRATLFTDKTGARMPISKALFQAPDGSWKIDKRSRGVLTPFMAEALIDPDEIWLGLVEKGGEIVVDRRYIRVDPDASIIIVFEMGRLWWQETSAYNTTKKNKTAPDFRLLDIRRGGKLLWKRK